MIRYDDIIQQSAEWLEIKYGKIGGSTSKGLRVKTDTLMLKLLACRCEDFELEEDGYQSSDMQRGNELEPVVTNGYELLPLREICDNASVSFDVFKIRINSIIDGQVDIPSTGKKFMFQN